MQHFTPVTTGKTPAREAWESPSLSCLSGLSRGLVEPDRTDEPDRPSPISPVPPVAHPIQNTRGRTRLHSAIL